MNSSTNGNVVIKQTRCKLSSWKTLPLLLYDRGLYLDNIIIDFFYTNSESQFKAW